MYRTARPTQRMYYLSLIHMKTTAQLNYSHNIVTKKKKGGDHPSVQTYDGC